MPSKYQEVRELVPGDGCPDPSADPPETLGLSVPARARKPCVQGAARLLASVAVVSGVLVLVASWRALSPCTPRAGGAEQSFVSLAQNDPEDLINMAAIPRDRDAVMEWLAVTNAAEGAASAAEAENTVRQAMAVKDPKAARKMLQRAMDRAATRWRSKRRQLKGFLKERSKAFRRERTPAQKASVASCVFDTLQATTQLAALAAGINDAAKTCPNVKDNQTLNSWYGKVCSVNNDMILYSVASIASSLSVAANNCAETIVPNVNALCAGSITGLISMLAQFGVAADLTAAGCNPLEKVPPGVTPSVIGQAGTSEAFEHRRLSEDRASSHVQARRLLFGGGIDSTAAFCAVDVTSAAWYLAQAGLAINAAANKNAGATCPPKNKVGGTLIKGAVYRQSQGFCAVDVSGAIYAFLQAIFFLNFAFVHCTDTLNTHALCGAGISGILAAFDGVAYAGTSMWLACNEFQDKGPLMPAPPMPAGNSLGNSGIFGRRLSAEADEGISALSQQFSSPTEAWRSIGYDLDDPQAEFRKAAPRAPSAEGLLGLAEEAAAAPGAGAVPREEGGLFGASRQCS